MICTAPMTRAVDMVNPPKPQQQSHGDNESLGIASREVFRSNSELKSELQRLVHLIPDEGDCETKVFDDISCILATLKKRKLRSQNDKSVTNRVTITQSDKSVSSSVPITPEEKKHIAELVDELSADHQSQRRKAAWNLRVCTNKLHSSRAYMGGAQMIPTLITLLSPDLKTQEHLVTTLMNLSIHKPNKSLIAEEGGIPPIVEVLRSGNMAARENAAQALFRLSYIKEIRAQIGACDAIPPLVELLRVGNGRGKQDAANALFFLCRYQKDNKSRSVRAGLVPVLLELMSTEEAMGDLYLSILFCLSVSEEGLKAIGEAGALPLLMEYIKAEERSKNKEKAVKILSEERSKNKEKAVKILSEERSKNKEKAVKILSEERSKNKEKAVKILPEERSKNKEKAVRILSKLCSNDTRYLEEVKRGAGYKQALTDLCLTDSSTAGQFATQLLARISRYQRQITRGPTVPERRKEMAMADGSFTLGFIGAGKMSEAIARGLDKSGILPSSRMRTAHAHLPRREAFASFGVTVMESNSKVVEECEVIVLEVEPQVVKEVLIDLKPILSDAKLLVSIAAGVKLKDLEEWAGKARVVRVMPNTPYLVGESAEVMSLGEKATAEDEKLVKGLFEAVGKIWTAKEELLDAITGLSGSGPAYIYLAIEALADGGVAAGLPQELASSLAPQTVLGAAKMVMDTKKSPGQLKDEVLSPAGTTIAGIHELEKGRFRATLMNAVIAAAKRSEELSKT